MPAIPEHRTGTCDSGDVTLHYRRFGTAGGTPFLSAVRRSATVTVGVQNAATPDADETTRQPATQPEPVDAEGPIA